MRTQTNTSTPRATIATCACIQRCRAAGLSRSKPSTVHSISSTSGSARSPFSLLSGAAMIPSRQSRPQGSRRQPGVKRKRKYPHRASRENRVANWAIRCTPYRMVLSSSGASSHREATASASTWGRACPSTRNKSRQNSRKRLAMHRCSHRLNCFFSRTPPPRYTCSRLKLNMVRGRPRGPDRLPATTSAIRFGSSTSCSSGRRLAVSSNRGGPSNPGQ